MLRKLVSSTFVVALAVLLSTTGTFAAKPAPNQAPVVTAFDVAAESASPVPVSTFTATDADGNETIAGYLITETPTKPSAGIDGWSAAPPTQYTTTSLGGVTLYAWAKDNTNAVSDSRSDTVTIIQPSIDADTLDGKHASEFAAAAHDHDAAAIATGTLGVEHLATYAGIRIVHKGLVDGVATFNTITDALNAIADAADGNRYLVKVMPGVYQEAISMKAFVDVQGAGQENVIVQYDGNDLPTVTWNVDNAVLSTISLRSSTYQIGSTLSVDLGGVAVLRDVKMIVDRGYVSSGTSYGIMVQPGAGRLRMERCVYFSTVTNMSLSSYVAPVEIFDSSITIASTYGTKTAVGIIAYNDLTLSNSRISITTPGYAMAVLLRDGDNHELVDCELTATGQSAIALNVQTFSNLVLENSRVAATATTPEYATGLYMPDGRVVNTTVTTNGYALQGSMEVLNSSIEGGVGSVQANSSAIIMANTKVKGGSTGMLGVVKMVNCFDENFNPIPNY